MAMFWGAFFGAIAGCMVIGVMCVFATKGSGGK